MYGSSAVTCGPVSEKNAQRIHSLHSSIMATQFLVRSPGNKHAIPVKAVLYDGVELTKIDEDGMSVFQLSDPGVTVELVVRRTPNAPPVEVVRWRPI